MEVFVDKMRRMNSPAPPASMLSALCPGGAGSSPSIKNRSINCSNVLEKMIGSHTRLVSVTPGAASDKTVDVAAGGLSNVVRMSNRGNGNSSNNNNHAALSSTMSFEDSEEARRRHETAAMIASFAKEHARLTSARQQHQQLQQAPLRLVGSPQCPAVTNHSSPVSCPRRKDQEHSVRSPTMASATAPAGSSSGSATRSTLFSSIGFGLDPTMTLSSNDATEAASKAVRDAFERGGVMGLINKQRNTNSSRLHVKMGVPARVNSSSKLQQTTVVQVPEPMYVDIGTITRLLMNYLQPAPKRSGGSNTNPKMFPIEIVVGGIVVPSCSCGPEMCQNDEEDDQAVCTAVACVSLIKEEDKEMSTSSAEETKPTVITAANENESTTKVNAQKNKASSNNNKAASVADTLSTLRQKHYLHNFSRHSSSSSHDSHHSPSGAVTALHQGVNVTTINNDRSQQNVQLTNTLSPTSVTTPTHTPTTPVPASWAAAAAAAESEQQQQRNDRRFSEDPSPATAALQAAAQALANEHAVAAAVSSPVSHHDSHRHLTFLLNHHHNQQQQQLQQHQLQQQQPLQHHQQPRNRHPSLHIMQQAQHLLQHANATNPLHMTSLHLQAQQAAVHAAAAHQYRTPASAPAGLLVRINPPVHRSTSMEMLARISAEMHEHTKALQQTAAAQVQVAEEQQQREAAARAVVAQRVLAEQQQQKQQQQQEEQRQQREAEAIKVAAAAAKQEEQQNRVAAEVVASGKCRERKLSLERKSSLVGETEDRSNNTAKPIPTIVTSGPSSAPTPAAAAAVEANSEVESYKQDAQSIGDKEKTGYNYKKLPPGITPKNNKRLFVKHQYADHSRELPRPDELDLVAAAVVSGLSSVTSGRATAAHSSGSTGGGTKENQRTPNAAFPLKLHETLTQIEMDGLDHIIGWLPHGRSFKIFKQNEFVEKILPKYFVMTKKSSFLRQLNLYGFNRLTRLGPDHASYYHEKFLRGMKFLSRRMQRQKVNGNGIRAAGNPDEEPDFFKFPSCPPEAAPAVTVAAPAAAAPAQDPPAPPVVRPIETFSGATCGLLAVAAAAAAAAANDAFPTAAPTSSSSASSSASLESSSVQQSRQSQALKKKKSSHLHDNGETPTKSIYPNFERKVDHDEIDNEKNSPVAPTLSQKDTTFCEQLLRASAGTQVSFPLKLQRILDKLEAENKTDIISWLPHGRAFIVHDSHRFVTELMPNWFNQSKYSSFQRQLHMYNFQRITAPGRDKGAYHHPNFLRGKPQLALTMRRTRVNGKGTRRPGNPDIEPDFYAMEAMAGIDPSTEIEIPMEGGFGSPSGCGNSVAGGAGGCCSSSKDDNSEYYDGEGYDDDDQNDDQQ